MAEKAKEKETKAVASQRSFMTFPRWERDMERMMEEFFWTADETVVARKMV